MRRKLYRFVLAVTFLGMMNTVLGPPAQAIDLIVCQGETITYRIGNYCVRCHFTSCCAGDVDGNVECWSVQDFCEECGTGTPV